MPEAPEFGFDVACAGHVTIGEMTEVELDAGLKAPFERDLVDGDRALAAIHRGGEMPRRVEMRGVVGREPNPLDRPALRVGQFVLAQAREELDDFRGTLPVRAIVDLRRIAGRIGCHVILERDRDVNERPRHGSVHNAGAR